MSATETPWEILGVSENATDADIKKAFRVLARESHPDANGGGADVTAKFQNITHAYDQIQTEEKRQAWRIKMAQTSGPNGGPMFTPPTTNIIDKDVEITFAQAYSGATLRLSIESIEPCGRCGGTGCPLCLKGKVKQMYPIRVNIPQGVKNGQQLKVASADLPEVVLTVLVKENKVFKRLDNPADLMMSVPITFSEACLGTRVHIPTPAKAVALKIPAGTQVGKTLRVPGHGFSKFGSPPTKPEFGDLYVRVSVLIPEDISGAQAKLVRQLGVYDPKNIRERLITDLGD